MKAPARPAPLTLEMFRRQNSTGRSQCTLHSFLQTLSDHDVAEVRAAIADLTIQASAIARVLQERGYTKTHQVIQKHRREGCVDCRMTAITGGARRA